MAVDNKRIAKNTIFLYVRMLATMLVGLYTSRVILQNLGIDDYGIYGVVGGIVGFMGFLNGALATSSSRFLTYALGEGNIEKSQRTFATTLTIHVILGFIILIIGEAIGPWMIVHKLLIPEDRLVAAQWAFQFSILTTSIGISQVPYSATIVAHEKMDIYAYMAMVDILLRLTIAISLSYWGGDRLIFFAMLLFLQSVGTMAFYRFYCAFKFQEARTRLFVDVGIFRQIAAFSIWNLITMLINSLNSYGTTILQGIFFSPAIVAAKSISVKVNQMMTQFIGNFRQAMNPQIVKLYASNEMAEFRKLTLQSAQYSFYIMWVMLLPMLLGLSEILHLWLGNVPNLSEEFTRLMLVSSSFWLFDSAFQQGLVATGNIKKASLLSCVSNGLIFPVLYVIYKLGGDPLWSVRVSLICAIILSTIIKPYLLVIQVDFKWCDFIKIYYRCLLVVLTSSIIPISLKLLLSIDSFWQLILIILVSVLSSLFCVFYIGIDKGVRQKVCFKICSKLRFL